VAKERLARLPSIEHVCILCGRRFVGWGHNPEPIAPYVDGLACSTCNAERIIPTRLRRVYQERRP
jgi:hypothetical protein